MKPLVSICTSAPISTIFTPSCAAFCLSTSTFQSIRGNVKVDLTLAIPSIPSLRNFSILSVASITSLSLSANIPICNGDEKSGPPSSSAISTIIPGISFTLSFAISIICLPESSLSLGSFSSKKPLPTTSPPERNHSVPVLRKRLSIPLISSNFDSTLSIIDFVSNDERFPRALIETSAATGSIFEKYIVPFPNLEYEITIKDKITKTAMMVSIGRLANILTHLLYFSAMLSNKYSPVLSVSPPDRAELR